MSAGKPLFSLIIPTRNRPAILRRALMSIAEQSCGDYEAIIVDDGSSSDNAAALRALRQELDERFVFIRRALDEPRHGPHIARNTGFSHARGAWIGFLDDDDYWCDAHHLEKARACLRDVAGVDMYIANQIARRGDETVVSPWLPYVERVLAQRRRVAEPDTYELRREDLLQPEGIGFAHVNMSIIRRELFASVDGFWDELPYEEDLNFFLRLMDGGEKFVYRAATVSVNTLRELVTDEGASSLSGESKLLFRAVACQHALLHCRRPEVRKYVRLLHGGVFKTLAKQHYRARHFPLASALATQAAAVDPSLKWRLIAAALKLRSAVSPTQA